MPITVRPDSSRRRAKEKPMKPAAPVTRTGSAVDVVISAPSRWRPRGTPDADIDESARRHVVRLVDIAEVDHDGLAQDGAHAVEVVRAKLIPLGEDHQRAATFDAGIGIG